MLERYQKQSSKMLKIYTKYKQQIQQHAQNIPKRYTKDNKYTYTQKIPKRNPHSTQLTYQKYTSCTSKGSNRYPNSAQTQKITKWSRTGIQKIIIITILLVFIIVLLFCIVLNNYYHFLLLLSYYIIYC